MKTKFFVGHLFLVFVLYQAVVLRYNIIDVSSPSPEMFMVFFLGALGLGILFCTVMHHFVDKSRTL